MKQKAISAYLTVYLTLTLTILLSLALTLIEGVRSNAVRLEAECVTDIAMNSIFAEYHRQLYEQYNLFAIDTSYGTSMPVIQNTVRHLEHYLERNVTLEGIFLEDYLYRDFLGMGIGSVDITRGSILTDHGGEVFVQSAVDAVRDEIGLNGFAELKEWLTTVEAEALTDTDVESWKQSVDEEIQSYDGKEIQISETETHKVHIENPTDALEAQRKKGILSMVLPEDSVLSGRSIICEDLIGARMARGEINTGNGDRLEQTASEELLERFLFQEYLLRYMGYFGQEKEVSALSYQIEYLLEGKESDEENLKSVVNTICLMREAANVLYLYSDQEKRTVTEALASVLATLMMVPEIEPLLDVTLTLGWAYAESVYDVRSLLTGGKVPLLKDEDTWHYGLEGALGASGKDADASGTGLGYEDYLRILLMLEEKDAVVTRAMDMVEADIRLTAGNRDFRLDGCYEWVEAVVQIKSRYGYEYEIVREYGYRWK